MPPSQNPLGVADAGRGCRSHPAAQHHVAARRPDLPCPSRQSATLGLLPLARTSETTQSPLPLRLPILQASFSTFAVQQTLQPQSNGEFSAV